MAEAPSRPACWRLAPGPTSGTIHYERHGVGTHFARDAAGRRATLIYGRLWDNGLYPAARCGKPGGPMVAGVVFEVSAEDLALFDAREGAAGNWYRRVKVRTVEGEVAWMYEAARCLTDARGCRSQWQAVPPDEHGVASWDHQRPYWRGANRACGSGD